MSETVTDKDALEFLVELGKKLSPVETLDFGGRKYTRQQINKVAEPTVTALSVSTLSGLADLCTGKFTPTGNPSGEVPANGFEGFNPYQHLIHVVSEKQVQVVTTRSNVWKERDVLIDCKMTETLPFQFGKFLGQDEFIIAMLSCFVKEEPLTTLAKIAGRATAEIVTTSQDDGVSQVVAQRTGAHLENQVQVQNIVSLRPYRTFREVEQPASDFLVRLQQSGEVVPKFALFEADGGAWKLKAIENVARNLRTAVPGATVVS